MDETVCLKCSNALTFLTQLIGDNMLALGVQFVNQYMSHQTSSQNNNWITKFVCLSALMSVVEGSSPQSLQQHFSDFIGWIYERSKDQELKIQSISASLLSLLATHCPNLLAADEQSIQTFFTWFNFAMSNPHPRIVMHSSRAVSSFYISMAKYHKVD